MKRLAIVAGTAVLAIGAGVAVAASQDNSPTSTSSSQPGLTRQDDGGGQMGGAQAPFDLSTLADELGVSESRLQDALEAARPSAGSGPPDATSMAQALADELNLSVDKVQAALEATMPQGGPPGANGQTTPPSDGQTTPPSSGTTTPPSSGTTSQS